MSQFAVKGIDKYYNKAKYDPNPFPVKPGDAVIVKATCEVVEKNSMDPEARYECAFQDQCKWSWCHDDNESEFSTIVETIFDRGQGWQIMVAGLTVELPMSDYGTSFWKREGAKND